jgi:hypothetical protein
MHFGCRRYNINNNYSYSYIPLFLVLTLIFNVSPLFNSTDGELFKSRSTVHHLFSRQAGCLDCAVRNVWLFIVRKYSICCVLTDDP